MPLNEGLLDLSKYAVEPGKKIKLKDFDTEYTGNQINKTEAVEVLKLGRARLAEIQDKLYAHNQYSVLIILQAMDAAGKDGTIKHIMSGLNPTGVKVHSFKAPSSTELDHDYLWRHAKAMPARGEIAIHNRSHYENVLVTRVHPEWILHERIPGIDSVKDIDKEFWEKRFRQINRFEENLVENGTVILKFFLNVSKKEQKKRFLERIDDSAKNWKFSLSDIKERAHWDDYQKAFEEAISATSRKHAPWFIIPADDKWFSRLAIAAVIYRQFNMLDLSYPEVTPAQKAELQKAKEQLLAENENKKKG